MAATNKNMTFDVNLLPATTGDHNLGSSDLKWKINGVADPKLTDTNTWRGIQDNLTSSTNTTESLSAKQGYLLANGSARDSTKVSKSGDTMTGLLTAKKITIEHTAGEQQEYRITYGSTVDMSFMVGTGNENHGIYDSKASKWMIYADINGNVAVNGNASTATEFSSGTTVKLTGDITGESSSSKKGWSIATTIGEGKVTNAMLAGSIANGKLANSSIKIGNKTISLGGTATLADIGVSYPVTGVKGNAENSYRTGQVNLTAANVGAYSTTEIDNRLKKYLPYSHYSNINSNNNGKYYKISINSTVAWMLNFTVKLYHVYRAYDLQISGYNYGSNHWYSPAAIILGASTTYAIEVIFGYDSDYHLWIAIPAQQYTGIDVLNATNGFSQITDIENLFSIELVDGEPTTKQKTITAYRPWYRNETIPIDNGGTGATTVAGARTNLGLGTIALKADTDYLPYKGNVTALGSGSPHTSVKTWWENTTTVPKLSVLAAYNNSGAEKTLIFSKGNADTTYGTVLAWGYTDKYLRILRKNNANSWISSDWEKIDAGYADSAGSVALSGVSGADDLKAIEALSGTSGFLKKTAANTWTLDTNTYVTSVAGNTGAITADTLRTSLGLSNAMHFLGVTTTNVSTGTPNTTATVTIDGSNVTAAAGDVVLYGSQEYVWGNSKWNLLGDESSYKVKQTAKSDPTASTSTSTTFIDTISQDANGVITATKKTLPSYVATSAGVTAVTWDSTNKKLTRTINGSAADVVTISTIKTALALTKSDVGLGNVANSTYAGGTAVTLNNSSKASSTASFYAPTTGGTADTQALVGNGATSAPKWVDISPSITIGAGTASAAPTVNVTVLGRSGTAKSITTASTSVYGVTKLNDGIASNSTALAATANSALIAAKKVASSNSTSKLYLVGATSQSTTGVDSYSYQYTYTNNGLLSALKVGLNLNGTEKAHLEWNDTDQSIDFIFN